jgi:hypothetical protein
MVPWHMRNKKRPPRDLGPTDEREDWAMKSRRLISVYGKPIAGNYLQLKRSCLHDPQIWVIPPHITLFFIL